MTAFSFEVTADTARYCEEVLRCLQQYAGYGHDEALLLVNRFWSDEPRFGNDDARLHESPYYWAMCMAHDRTLGDNRPDWTDDRSLWPPPDDFRQRWYGQTEISEADKAKLAAMLAAAKSPKRWF